MQSPDEDEDDFHNSFQHFYSSLEMLAAPASEQCALMGNYNVAWELKDDVAAGRFLVGRGYLTDSQEAWVRALSAALESMNTLVLPAGASWDSNLLAMNNVGWEPLRYLAKEIIRQLALFPDGHPNCSTHGHPNCSRQDGAIMPGLR